jgi:hypothetical protein
MTRSRFEPIASLGDCTAPLSSAFICNADTPVRTRATSVSIAFKRRAARESAAHVSFPDASDHRALSWSPSSVRRISLVPRPGSAR